MPKKRCGKQRTFDTRPQAYYAMLKVPAKDSGQVPFRIYFCRQHKGYHYTSKAIYKNGGRR